LIVYCRGGSWHAMVSFKALDLKWFGEGGSFKEALKALEASLGKEEADTTEKHPRIRSNGIPKS